MPADYRPACKRYWHQDGLGPATGARKVSDLLTRREFHRTELYQYAAGPVGIEDMSRLWLDPAHASAARLEFDRAQRDFSERDRDVLDVLAPHFTQLHTRALTRRQASLPVTSEKPTAREREILALVAAGNTTAMIAAELWISAGTVRKHLDNVFAKLGVHTRVLPDLLRRRIQDTVLGLLLAVRQLLHSARLASTSPGDQGASREVNGRDKYCGNGGPGHLPVVANNRRG